MRISCRVERVRAHMMFHDHVDDLLQSGLNGVCWHMWSGHGAGVNEKRPPLLSKQEKGAPGEPGRHTR